MLARLAVLASLLAASGLACAQLPERPEPEFIFVLSGMTLSSQDDLVPGEPVAIALPVRRLCALEMAVLDEQQVLLTLDGPAFRFEAPLFLEYSQALCHSADDAAVLEFTVTALGTLDGNQSFTLRLDPQEPENGLHGPGEPQTLLVGLVVANMTVEPATEPVPSLPKESSEPAAVVVAASLFVGSLLRRRPR